VDKQSRRADGVISAQPGREAMEQIKAVGKAIRNSPRAIRKKLGHDPGHESKQAYERLLTHLT